MGQLIPFPTKQTQTDEYEDEMDKQYRLYYDEEEKFFLEHGYYEHNSPDEINSPE